MEQKITKKMTFAEVLEKHPEVAGVLMEKGMHCIGCPMSQMESLEDGIKAHGLNVDEIVKELNKKIKNDK
jgi:hydroxylamine reductase